MKPQPTNPADRLVIERGSLRDYAQLAEHHYRANRPATAMRVLVMRDPQQGIVSRYLKQTHKPAPVAVLVESLPTLNCQLRDWALHERYGSWLPPRQRSRLLTQELRCISRVVVHPQWRGLGLAVRLVKHALAHPQTQFTEALAAMGKVNPFFERAGMTAYRRQPHAFDARLVAALEAVELSPRDLAQLGVMQTRIDALPAERKQWLLAELFRWYRQNGGGRRGDCSKDPQVHLKLAQSRLLLEPVYYLHDNREQLNQQTPPAEHAHATT